MIDSVAVSELRRVARGASWGVADQALSSLTNFALGVLIAREGPRAFGAFSLAFTFYLVLLNVTRATTTEPLLIRWSGEPGAQWRSAVRRSSGLATVIGLTGVPVCLVIAALVPDPALRAAFLGLAVGMPGLLLQDYWRFAFFAVAQGHKAFLTDLTWALALIPALVVAELLGGDVLHLVLAWGAAASMGALTGMWLAGLLPRPLRARAWYAEQRDLVTRFIGEFLAVAGTLQLALTGVGAIAGLVAVGAIRAAEVLLGPLNVLFTGLESVAIPEGLRLFARSPGHLVRGAAAFATGLALAALAFGGVLLLVPDDLGRALLDESWDAARPLVVPITLRFVTSAARAGAQLGLRTLSDASGSLRARLIASVLLLGGTLVGAVVGGALGAAWGMTLTGVVGSAVWWTQFLASVRALQESLPTIGTAPGVTSKGQEP